jgi:hypothetical protein
VTAGSTTEATVDSGHPSPCGTGDDITAPGIWYTVVGTGNEMTASTCFEDSSGSTEYDSMISVYCATCREPICVNGNDDGGTSFFCNFTFGSTVRWCSLAGVTYQVLVHGFFDETGDFELHIFDGGPCTDPVPCTVDMPVGGGDTGVGLVAVRLSKKSSSKPSLDCPGRPGAR